MSKLQKLIELEQDTRKFGFDWPDQFMILDQIIDECREVREEIDQGSNKEKLQEEIGDLLHSVISLCIFSGFNVEETIDKTNAKFSGRMKLLKELTKREGLENLRGQNIDFMLKLWKEAKKMEYENKIVEAHIKLEGVECTESPATADIDFLTHKINQETPEFGEAHPFAFFMRDDKSQIIAGCNGSVIFGSIYTDQLWVHPAHRKNGLGHKLMEAVHDYGRKSGCAMATACTMSFQGAKAFYEKLGYGVDFERHGYIQNSNCLFMRKEL